MWRYNYSDELYHFGFGTKSKSKSKKKKQSSLGKTLSSLKKSASKKVKSAKKKVNKTVKSTTKKVKKTVSDLDDKTRSTRKVTGKSGNYKYSATVKGKSFLEKVTGKSNKYSKSKKKVPGVKLKDGEAVSSSTRKRTNNSKSIDVGRAAEKAIGNAYYYSVKGAASASKATKKVKKKVKKAAKQYSSNYKKIKSNLRKAGYK